MRRRGLRLPLVHPPDPVLDEDELDFLADELRGILLNVAAEQERGRVSESVIRRRMSAESVLEKLYRAGAWRPGAHR